MKFFTADLHLGHKNIIDFCGRPFRKDDGQIDTAAMHTKMAENWDRVVKPGDEVFVLGDIGFNVDAAYSWLLGRPGQKFWVFGNHDRDQQKKRLSKLFVKTGDILETRVFDQFIVMCHYPMLRWNRAHHGSWMVHGHCHGTLEYPFQGKIVDVGVDKWDFTPVSYDRLRDYMDVKPLVEHYNDREQD
jgi:calcineurin-like phosphoesterase family protein